MPKPLACITVLPRRTPQLQLINEKIAGLAALKPWNDIYRSFSVAAQLASDAVTAAEELQQWLHDTFLDVSWPHCPDHGQHPLWLSDARPPIWPPR